MSGSWDPGVAKETEEAIKFLVHKIEESGKNTKPVILHSLRVGLYLQKGEYTSEVVIAGFLHDLLEDSDTSFEEISQRFGKRVAELVLANSFDKTVKDDKKRYEQTFQRGMKVGKDALLIKAADILDNSYYYPLVKDKKTYDWLIEGKLKYFIENTKEIIGEEKVWKELNGRIDKLGRVRFDS
jgi:(p)ppGpp synthase/HD superfamily hydrolase